MAAKGTEAKAIISNKILGMFEGAFIDGKDLRIPMTENGEYLEIKVALTAAKEPVRPNGITTDTVQAANPAEPTPINVSLTTEEKAEVASLLQKLGL